MPKKQSDGRYRAKITIGNDLDGKPIVKYVSGRTKAELEDAKRAAREYYIDGTGLEQDRIFGEYAVEWYRTKKEPHLSESSRTGYSVYLNKHILPVFSARMMRAIKAVEIQTWINGYSGKSGTAITMLMSIVRGIMSSALADGIIPRDPTAALVRPKVTPPAKRRALTDEERTAVLKTIDRHRHGAYLAILYYLGVRRGEALALQWGDFDWQAGLVHVQRDIDYARGNAGVVGALKTAASDRFIPIPQDLRAVLDPLRGLPNTLLFFGERGQIIPYSTMERMWMELMIDAGLAERVERDEDAAPDIRLDWKATITPHYLRHNYITMLYDAGVDPMVAMRLVGHSDYQTTANIYTHLKEEHLRKAADSLDGVFSKKVAEKLPKKKPSRK